MSTNNTPTCPTGCSSLLPANHYDLCDQDIHTGEIQHIYFANVDAECFTDWTVSTEWLARISADSLDPDAIRRFRGSGDLPVAAQDTIDISLCQKFYTDKTFTINFSVEDTHEDNYNFLRTLECNTTLKMWFATDDLMFGGNCGEEVNVSANYKIDRGCKTLHYIELVITWDNKFSSERCVNPLA